MKSNRTVIIMWFAIPILVIATVIGCLFLFKDVGKEYLVDYTGYFHSTDNPDKCRFIAIAKDRNYTISRISKDEARFHKKNICKECYTQQEQDEYNKLLRWIIERDRFSEERKAWQKLESKQEIDYTELIVYMEDNGTMHIEGDCYMVKNKNTTRVQLEQITRFATTCEECVGREFCDFIYKKVYEGIYDTSLIKEIDEIDTDY